MRRSLALGLAASAFVAGAQTTNFNQIQHIETALNHLTVIDMGEPVTMLAVANPDSFQIERHDDKVFLKPLKEGASTNLFIWTATRQQSYELDPAGDLSKMNVLVRNLPSSTPSRTAQNKSPEEPSDREIQRIASLVLPQALIGAEGISHEGIKTEQNHIEVDLEQVFRARDALYLRYSIANLTKHPFRVTTPNVYSLSPSRLAISLESLRDHQLPRQTADSFEIQAKTNLPVTNAEFQAQDLAPGQKAIGVVSIKGSWANPPELYELQFGNDQDQPVTVRAVL
jgi:hypothetical protein